MRLTLCTTVFTIFCVALAEPSWGQEKKTALASDGWGTLKGKVTLDGPMPTLDDFKAKMAQHQDGKICCLKGSEKELVDPTWAIDPKTKAVANVIVYLKAPAKTYFPIPKEELNRKDLVSIDQPHCAFLPHVVAIFPVYYDGAKMIKTGQKFIIKNSANVLHNARLVSLEDQGFSVGIPPGGEREYALLPERLPLQLRCDIHPWMSARIAVFDHPFYAITKEGGTFEIPRVPAGAKVSVHAYHHVYVLGKQGREMTFKKGETTTLDFQVKSPAK